MLDKVLEALHGQNLSLLQHLGVAVGLFNCYIYLHIFYFYWDLPYYQS